MTTDDPDTYRAWRRVALETIRVGRRLERVAQLTELPLVVRPHWPGLDWVEYSGDLADFASRVKRTAARLGPPDSVTAEHWLGAIDDHPPDLVARWTTRDAIGEIAVTVRALRPTGCRIDPRTAHVPAQTPSIHPECAAVLRELEDAR